MVVVTDELMRRHPDAPEGDLAWMRQRVVDRAACAAVARRTGLPERLLAAAPAGTDGVDEIARNAGVQAALTEAVIGAAWLDLPRAEVEDAVRAAFAPELDEAVPGARDAKTTLQETVQRDGRRVVYELVRTRGPAHARVFRTRVSLDGRPLAEGEGPSRRASEQQAARSALDVLAHRQTPEVAPQREG
jgi:ribonuclease III